jgi:hypothetical protein
MPFVDVDVWGIGFETKTHLSTIFFYKIWWSGQTLRIQRRCFLLGMGCAESGAFSRDHYTSISSERLAGSYISRHSWITRPCHIRKKYFRENQTVHSCLRRPGRRTTSGSLSMTRLDLNRTPIKSSFTQKRLLGLDNVSEPFHFDTHSCSFTSPTTPIVIILLD